MIPIQLRLSGFLSYLEPTEIDFSAIEVACISGPNGAGKSSLLDAITWALFGEARKRDDSLIHANAKAAEVALLFSYEGGLYRVQRTKPRDKTALLEFHIAQNQDPSSTSPTTWKPLTERSLRETERRIREVLRLDYDTFVNASFFLQGKADQFTQQAPADRKRILSSILGLEIWESYRQRTANSRHEVDRSITDLDARLDEINTELNEEAVRKKQLHTLQGELERLKQQRTAQESILENARRIAATLAEQGKLVDTLARQLESTTRQTTELQARLQARQQEQLSHTARLAHAAETETAHAAWLAARQELARWDEIAGRFREQEKRREAPRLEIQEAKARLEQELTGLQASQAIVENEAAESAHLKIQIEEARRQSATAEARLAERRRLDAELQTTLLRQSAAKAENPLLKAEMESLKERIERLEAAEGAVCPLCGQPLSSSERERLVVELNAQGKDKGDRYRDNQQLLRSVENEVTNLNALLKPLASAEADLHQSAQTETQLSSRLEQLSARQAAWQKSGSPRLVEIDNALSESGYAPQAFTRLAEIDASLKAIGYDAVEHDRLRQAEQTGRATEAALRQLETARAALQPIEREIAGLQTQFIELQKELNARRSEYDSAASAFATAQTQAPDLHTAELALLEYKENENQLQREVGAAQQKVSVLGDLKKRHTALTTQREEQALLVGRYRRLERAFSKDGVPALLIEQALPQIEAKANEILDRLSGGSMSVRFITQASYKDRRRDDMKETLDIQISDGVGTRDYEMFSGGEAFRVNFAIRLALSEILAQRAGARLQTLVIDEGFGSQDALGRQRLVEAINQVRSDFAKILVITHIDELKDAFPSRIEVEKTSSGSRVHVL